MEVFGGPRFLAALRQFLLSLTALAGMIDGTAAAQSRPRFSSDAPNELAFPAREARFVRLVIEATSANEPCLDELEVYAEGSQENLALAASQAKATASSCLSGYAMHQIAHLNDGRYGNSRSWIAGGATNEWAQIELPQLAKVAKVVFSRDREGHYRDRLPRIVEVWLSLDGQRWQTVRRVEGELPPSGLAPSADYVPPAALPQPISWDGLLRYAFLCERQTWQRMARDDHLSPLQVDRPARPGGPPYWARVARLQPLERALVLMDEMIERLAVKGLEVSEEQSQLTALRRRQGALSTAATSDSATAESLYLDARLAKRRLMLRDPDLAPLERILFVKRHPYLSSHNYSDVLDSQFRPGGGVYVIETPRRDGRLAPEHARLTALFDASGGIARDAIADFDARVVYFAYRPATSPVKGQDPYWHLMTIGANGNGLRQLTDGPFHDYYPCPLPDGGLAFISTRCNARFLCWRPQAFVLFRLGREGEAPRPLSFANLSEWSPTVMRDGRILWTRSEYLDKGADFGHTLWAVRPDGSHPMLVFGNNTPNCYLNGREVPGSGELCCTLVAHGGDHNGPVGLINLEQGPFDPAAITNITPDVKPHYNMSWARYECFRDPTPVTRDYFLVSHAPADRFGLYLIDRFGNRELLYLDPEIGSMSPTPLRLTSRPPVLSGSDQQLAETQWGEFLVADVYQGLSPGVSRGRVKYLRVCQEVRAASPQLANGEFRQDVGPAFQDFYASPVHKLTGPHGWPSYVAKAALGIAPVEPDGSARFYAPAGRSLYFQVLDEDFNELQRMRSVIQLQPGERRSCIGCHEDRKTAPPLRQSLAAQRPPRVLEPPSWGAGPFSYEKVVQPVWDAKCIHCHDTRDQRAINLTGQLDADFVPASYRTLITRGWVHYFNCQWNLRHEKAEPLTFGTLKSRLWQILDGGHYDVRLTCDEMHRVKCWIDLNCPLWPDYQSRSDRLTARTAE